MIQWGNERFRPMIFPVIHLWVILKKKEPVQKSHSFVNQTTRVTVCYFTTCISSRQNETELLCPTLINREGRQKKKKKFKTSHFKYSVTHGSNTKFPVVFPGISHWYVQTHEFPGWSEDNGGN